ncbi:cytochrome P450 [Tanacetum coccineum]
MSNEDNRFLIQSMWGYSTFDYALNKANGKSGGIIAIWDTSKFHMTSSIIGDGFLALTGKWLSIDIDCLFIVVYAPQALNRKKKLWLDIKALVQSQNCLSVVMGDFNEVRNENERLGSHFCRRSASVFNEFILSVGLLDLPMGGMRFTQMNTLGLKLSKIDRILVSKHLIDRWLNSHTLALTKEFSDHSPIILINSVNDYVSHPVSGGNTGCDDTVHRTRYKIIHFTIYKEKKFGFA